MKKLKVAGFVDDLRVEKLNHEAAKRALEEKSRELENSALKMAELLEESTAVHERNVQLALKMQEMTSLRVEWEQEKEDMRQRLEDAEAHAAAAVAERRGGQGGGRDNEGDNSVRSEKGGEEEAETLLVKKELEQARAAVEFKTSQLEAVNARVSFDVGRYSCRSGAAEAPLTSGAFLSYSERQRTKCHQQYFSRPSEQVELMQYPLFPFWLDLCFGRHEVSYDFFGVILVVRKRSR